MSSTPEGKVKTKVKKLTTQRELPGLPVLFHRQFEDGHEYYVYPFEEKLVKDSKVKLDDLNLHDIIKAFIGGEYAE